MMLLRYIWRMQFCARLPRCQRHRIPCAPHAYARDVVAAETRGVIIDPHPQSLGRHTCRADGHLSGPSPPEIGCACPAHFRFAPLHRRHLHVAALVCLSS
ncbi:hypothetical protein B0H19DRAFT_1187166, partial [Mycena capillaripes]